MGKVSENHVKALSDKEAIEKIKHIAKGQTAILCTVGGGRTVEARPMHTSAIDDDGALWFTSHRDSAKNEQIARDATVQLLYAVPNHSEYLNLVGRAVVSRDQKKIDEIWNDFMKTWFAGKDDPNLTLIKVIPADGYYWDTKHNKMVQLAKIAFGAITGSETDDSIEGKLRV